MDDIINEYQHNSHSHAGIIRAGGDAAYRVHSLTFKFKGIWVLKGTQPIDGRGD